MLEVSNWHSQMYRNITQAVIWNRKQIHDKITIPKAHWMSKYMYCVFFLNGMETTQRKGRMQSAAWLLTTWDKPGLQNSEVEILLNTIFWPMACAWHFYKQNKELKNSDWREGCCQFWWQLPTMSLIDVINSWFSLKYYPYSGHMVSTCQCDNTCKVSLYNASVTCNNYLVMPVRFRNQFTGLFIIGCNLQYAYTLTQYTYLE